MESIDCTYRSQTSIPTEATTVFVSLELSRARWLVTSLSPNTSKISRHFVPGGDAAELLRLLSELGAKAERHVNAAVKITCIQEIGFDGFWIHRVLAANGIESHVGEAASIAVPRRHRRAKTDAIDGELLLRTLMGAESLAYARWWLSPPPRRRTAAGFRASARRWSKSELSTSTASRG